MATKKAGSGVFTRCRLFALYLSKKKPIGGAVLFAAGGGLLVPAING